MVPFEAFYDKTFRFPLHQGESSERDAWEPLGLELTLKMIEDV